MNKTSVKPKFWESKSLEEMTRKEWESLCDGCARCCLVKLQEPDSNRVYYTNVHCRYLDLEQCTCTEYLTRTTIMPDCLRLEPDDLHKLDWMPETCAYRLLSEGKPLPDWHPLVSGNPVSIHEAGISIRSFAISEADINEADIEDYIVDNWTQN